MSLGNHRTYSLLTYIQNIVLNIGNSAANYFRRTSRRPRCHGCSDDIVSHIAYRMSFLLLSEITTTAWMCSTYPSPSAHRRQIKRDDQAFKIRALILIHWYFTLLWWSWAGQTSEIKFKQIVSPRRYPQRSTITTWWHPYQSVILRIGSYAEGLRQCLPRKPGHVTSISPLRSKFVIVSIHPSLCWDFRRADSRTPNPGVILSHVLCVAYTKRPFPLKLSIISTDGYSSGLRHQIDAGIWVSLNGLLVLPCNSQVNN